jgi:hypothetical protein
MRQSAHLFVLAGIIEILLDDLFGINKTVLSFNPFNISLTDKYQRDNFILHRSLVIVSPFSTLYNGGFL